MAELANPGAAAATWTDYLGVGNAKVGMRVLQTASETLNLRYFHTDHLGSISVITDANGLVVERLSYDAWGKRRFPNGSDDPTGSITSQTTRGFTGQEELSVASLVHLNGRVYDPLLARMTSADPTVTDPLNPQGWNRYSYVGNDPLAFTDPNGFSWLSSFFHSVTNFFRSNPIARAIVQIAIAAVLTVTGAWTVVAAAASAAITTGLSGGNLGQMLRAGAIAGATAFAFSTIGPSPSFAAIASNPVGFAAYVGENAAVGCASSVLSGGSCGSGAASAAVSAGLAPMLPGDIIGGTLTRATVGGLASVAGGGKFANGAVTGAFQYLATTSLEDVRRDPRMDAYDADVPGAGHNGGPPLDNDPGTVRVPVPAMAGLVGLGGVVFKLAADALGNYSTWDTSGGLKGINTNVTADEFSASLQSRGYIATNTMGSNGPVTILQDGQGSTYTIYTRTTTGDSGVQYVGPNGGKLKFNLGR